MCRNAAKLQYPLKPAILSILPIVDEFVIALGESDEDDATEALINSIQSDKVKIIRTVWDLEKYPDGMENAHQTDLAKNECKGVWCFYLQADEVIHEKYLAEIEAACKAHKDNLKVDGFLFNYLHFYGDYDHYQESYAWYPNEIRIVRNDSAIHSWKSAQSFRRIPEFDGLNYRIEQGSYKLNVKKLNAFVYHYGWVRHPKFMQKKSKALDTIHQGEKKANDAYANKTPEYDYGNLSLLPRFKDSHPEVMQDQIAQIDWKHLLHYESDYKPTRPALKHEKFKSKVLTWIVQNLLGGNNIFGTRNWKIIK